MIRIREHEENILQDRNEELLEKGIGCCGIGICDIADELDTHVKTGIFDFAIIMLAGPHARVDDKLKLPVVEFEEGCKFVSQIFVMLTSLHTWETVEVDSTKKSKELNTMLWELREVLVDHLEGTLEHIFHDRGNLVLHERLIQNRVSTFRIAK